MSEAEKKLTAKRIWIAEPTDGDTYAEFVGSFCIAKKTKVTARISCDSIFTMWVNDEIVGFGQCSDYPNYKMFDNLDITSALHEGENNFKIGVWYLGVDTQNYIVAEPMLSFLIEQDGVVLSQSGKDILSRKNLNYINGLKKIITNQLGYSFHYDNTVVNDRPFINSVELVGEFVAHDRGIEPLKLLPRVKTEVDGNLIDLKAETVGFLDLDIVSSVEQQIVIGYGEHQENGNVSQIINGRDFSVGFTAKKGENKYINTYRRLACRYLQIFSEYPIEIRYVGLRPVVREVEEIERDFGDKLVNQIYKVSVNTLKLCMHEHYEDCPWREQALYNMDSRNQMLCGYYAFKDAEYAKYNLLLMTHGQWFEDTVLSMCFPAGRTSFIPFFTLVYVIQIYEYISHTGDNDVLNKTADTLHKIIKGFKNKITEDNLIPIFKSPCWNFYEWTKGNSGIKCEIADIKNVYDVILNSMYVIACKYYDKIFGTVTDTSAVQTAIKKNFFDAEKGLFISSTVNGVYSQLANAMAILADVGDESIAEKLISDSSLTRISLSMNTFFYDALLKFGDKYKEFILNDIKEKYKSMLDKGATTFWETEGGYKDFGGAGSLCHGWSAMPIYYYSILCTENET